MECGESGRQGGESNTQAHINGNRIDMTRPVCPYPQVAVDNGVGTTSDTANFACPELPRQETTKDTTVAKSTTLDFSVRVHVRWLRGEA